jgi:tetratricopeptide (TPR) repeat protein
MLELGIGPEFDIYRLNGVAVVHRDATVADPSDFWQLATRLLLIQAQHSAWEELDWYRERLTQAYSQPVQSPVPLPGCLREASDLMEHVQRLGEQIRTGQRLEAFETLQKTRVLHEAVYPPGGELDRSAVKALRSLGGAALASGDRLCALELYSQAADAMAYAIESDPGIVNGWRDLANVLVEAERYPEAIRVYLRLIDSAPDHVRYRIRLARAHRANGQAEEAIAVLEQAIALAPGESRPLLELGNTYFLLERMNEAVAAYESALDVDNEIVEAHFGLAQAHDALGQADQAMQEYEAVIEIDPDHWLVEQARERLAELAQ